MRLLYGKGYVEEERKQMIPVVYYNTITSIQAVVSACAELGERVLETASGRILGGVRTAADLACRSAPGYPVPPCESMDVVKALSDDATVTPAVATCIAELWQHPHVQRAYGERNKFQLNDSAKFFFDKVHDIARPDYLPTVEDIVKTRVRTTGILEESYKVDGVDFVVYDVGGQRNERRKWIHAFDDVRAGLPATPLIDPRASPRTARRLLPSSSWLRSLNVSSARAADWRGHAAPHP